MAAKQKHLVKKKIRVSFVCNGEWWRHWNFIHKRVYVGFDWLKSQCVVVV